MTGAGTRWIRAALALADEHVRSQRRAGEGPDKTAFFRLLAEFQARPRVPGQWVLRVGRGADPGLRNGGLRLPGAALRPPLAGRSWTEASRWRTAACLGVGGLESGVGHRRPRALGRRREPDGRWVG
jgi:hypothetical protein